jgi:hypothetical protein
MKTIKVQEIPVLQTGRETTSLRKCRTALRVLPFDAKKGVYPYALRLRGAGQLRVIRDCKPTSRITRRLAIAGGIKTEIDNRPTPTR